ncbi:MAG: hypothetical protein Q9160_004287 [Pyrenula sp. 1 TL-2023]
MGMQITGFREHQDNSYTFQETTPTTILKFIEWAYKDDHVLEKAGASGNPKLVDGDTSSETAEECNEVLRHAHIYTFADAYRIEPLKDLAFTKITSTAKREWTLRKGTPKPPRDVNFQLSNRLMPVLAFCYADKLPEEDRLLGWLGQLVACRIEDLRAHPGFITTMR